MSIKLYGLGPSRSFRCLWALEEAGLEYEFIRLDLGSTDEDGAKSEHYLKLNSQGKVPTLEHNNFVLTESAAIVNYIGSLAADSGGGQFIPDEPSARAHYDELCYFTVTELEQPLWTAGKHKFAIPEEHRVTQVLKTAEWEFAKAVNALEKLTTLDDYATGGAFSFADVLLAHTINWADRFEFKVPMKLLQYRDRLYSRDAAVAAVAQLKYA